MYELRRPRLRVLPYGRCASARATTRRRGAAASGRDPDRDQVSAASRRTTSVDGRQAEIVEVKGSVELAPLTGLVEGIVDLTATGTTLRENGLVERERIADCTARLIANPVAHKLKAGALDRVLERLDAV